MKYANPGPCHDPAAGRGKRFSSSDPGRMTEATKVFLATLQSSKKNVLSLVVLSTHLEMTSSKRDSSRQQRRSTHGWLCHSFQTDNWFKKRKKMSFWVIACWIVWMNNSLWMEVTCILRAFLGSVLNLFDNCNK